MKNCRPYSWWIRLLDRLIGIRFVCDQRCYYKNEPCQYTKKNSKTLWILLKKFLGSKSCGGNCEQGRKPCDCDGSHHAKGGEQ